jgi:hypothetical protein
MKFDHPLVRNSHVFTARNLNGEEQKILVIVTTLTLDPASDGYKADLVERLNAAAHNYVRHSDHVTAYVLINRLKDWPARADKHRHHRDAPALHS